MGEHNAEKGLTIDQYLARYMNDLYGTRARVGWAVRTLLIQAWDEGYRTGQDAYAGRLEETPELLANGPQNPYRTNVLPPG